MVRCRGGGERDQRSQMWGKVRQALSVSCCSSCMTIHYMRPLCGQRLQTSVLRIDPNTLMMLQLSRTYHSSLSNALSTAACRHIPHAPLISAQTVLPRLVFPPISHLFWHLLLCVSFFSLQPGNLVLYFYCICLPPRVIIWTYGCLACRVLIITFPRNTM